MRLRYAARQRVSAARYDITRAIRAMPCCYSASHALRCALRREARAMPPFTLLRGVPLYATATPPRGDVAPRLIERCYAQMPPCYASACVYTSVYCLRALKMVLPARATGRYAATRGTRHAVYATAMICQEDADYAHFHCCRHAAAAMPIRLSMLYAIDADAADA